MTDTQLLTDKQLLLVLAAKDKLTQANDLKPLPKNLQRVLWRLKEELRETAEGGQTKCTNY